MATGKTHSRFYRLVADEIDLSGDINAVGSFGIKYDTGDVTGWSNGIKNFVLGHPRVFIDGFNAVFNNTATTGSHTELSAQETYYVSLLIGIRTAPTAGDPCFAAPLQQSSYVVAGDAPVTISANFDGPGQGDTLPSKCWGVALAASQQFTIAASSTTNGTAVDNGASTSNGALAYLHVTTASASALTIKIQDSADGTTYADLITFTADGATATAEQGSVSGTVNRYVRLAVSNANASQMTVTLTCTFVRL